MSVWRAHATELDELYTTHLRNTVGRILTPTPAYA